MIHRTEAVVLRSMKYGETSRIVTLFTRDRGKITVLARGARLPKSRFGSTLGPMSFIQIVYYYKPTRSIQMLSESSYVQPFNGIGKRLDRITTGLRIIELVHALTQEEEQNPQLFNLLIQSLNRLNVTEGKTDNILPFFQLKLSTILGFSPSINKDDVQAIPEEGGILSLDTGAILYPGSTAAIAGRYASRAALRAFAIFARADLDTVMRMRMEPEDALEVTGLVDAYMRHHFQEAYPSRSSRIIGQLL
jgi:DNA repair protein RecO (recombination protein O)